jgi:hypothetical protein
VLTQSRTPRYSGVRTSPTPPLKGRGGGCPEGSLPFLPSDNCVRTFIARYELWERSTGPLLVPSTGTSTHLPATGSICPVLGPNSRHEIRFAGHERCRDLGHQLHQSRLPGGAGFGVKRVKWVFSVFSLMPRDRPLRRRWFARCQSESLAERRIFCVVEGCLRSGCEPRHRAGVPEPGADARMDAGM